MYAEHGYDVYRGGVFDIFAKEDIVDMHHGGDKTPDTVIILSEIINRNGGPENFDGTVIWVTSLNDIISNEDDASCIAFAHYRMAAMLRSIKRSCVIGPGTARAWGKSHHGGKAGLPQGFDKTVVCFYASLIPQGVMVLNPIKSYESIKLTDDPSWASPKQNPYDPENYEPNFHQKMHNRDGWHFNATETCFRMMNCNIGCAVRLAIGAQALRSLDPSSELQGLEFLQACQMHEPHDMFVHKLMYAPEELMVRVTLPAIPKDHEDLEGFFPVPEYEEENPVAVQNGVTTFAATQIPNLEDLADETMMPKESGPKEKAHGPETPTSYAGTLGAPAANVPMPDPKPAPAARPWDDPPSPDQDPPMTPVKAQALTLENMNSKEKVPDMQVGPSELMETDMPIDVSRIFEGRPDQLESSDDDEDQIVHDARKLLPPSKESESSTPDEIQIPINQKAMKIAETVANQVTAKAAKDNVMLSNSLNAGQNVAKIAAGIQPAVKEMSAVLLAVDSDPTAAGMEDVQQTLASFDISQDDETMGASPVDIHGIDMTATISKEEAVRIESKQVHFQVEQDPDASYDVPMDEYMRPKMVLELEGGPAVTCYNEIADSKCPRIRKYQGKLKTLFGPLPAPWSEGHPMADKQFVALYLKEFYKSPSKDAEPVPWVVDRILVPKWEAESIMMIFKMAVSTYATPTEVFAVIPIGKGVKTAIPVLVRMPRNRPPPEEWEVSQSREPRRKSVGIDDDEIDTQADAGGGCSSFLEEPETISCWRRFRPNRANSRNYVKVIVKALIDLVCKDLEDAIALQRYLHTDPRDLLSVEGRRTLVEAKEKRRDGKLDELMRRYYLLALKDHGVESRAFGMYSAGQYSGGMQIGDYFRTAPFETPMLTIAVIPTEVIHPNTQRFIQGRPQSPERFIAKRRQDASPFATFIDPKRIFAGRSVHDPAHIADQLLEKYKADDDSVTSMSRQHWEDSASTPLEEAAVLLMNKVGKEKDTLPSRYRFQNLGGGEVLGPVRSLIWVGNFLFAEVPVPQGSGCDPNGFEEEYQSWLKDMGQDEREVVMKESRKTMRQRRELQTPRPYRWNQDPKKMVACAEKHELPESGVKNNVPVHKMKMYVLVACDKQHFVSFAGNISDHFWTAPVIDYSEGLRPWFDLPHIPREELLCEDWICDQFCRDLNKICRYGNPTCKGLREERIVDTDGGIRIGNLYNLWTTRIARGRPFPHYLRDWITFVNCLRTLSHSQGKPRFQVSCNALKKGRTRWVNSSSSEDIAAMRQWEAEGDAHAFEQEANGFWTTTEPRHFDEYWVQDLIVRTVHGHGGPVVPDPRTFMYYSLEPRSLEPSDRVYHCTKRSCLPNIINSGLIPASMRNIDSRSARGHRLNYLNLFNPFETVMVHEKDQRLKRLTREFTVRRKLYECSFQPEDVVIEMDPAMLLSNGIRLLQDSAGTIMTEDVIPPSLILKATSYTRRVERRKAESGMIHPHDPYTIIKMEPLSRLLYINVDAEFTLNASAIRSALILMSTVAHLGGIIVHEDQGGRNPMLLPTITNEPQPKPQGVEVNHRSMISLSNGTYCHSPIEDLPHNVQANHDGRFDKRGFRVPEILRGESVLRPLFKKMTHWHATINPFVDPKTHRVQMYTEERYTLPVVVSSMNSAHQREVERIGRGIMFTEHDVSPESYDATDDREFHKKFQRSLGFAPPDRLAVHMDHIRYCHNEGQCKILESEPIYYRRAQALARNSDVYMADKKARREPEDGLWPKKQLERRAPIIHPHSWMAADEQEYSRTEAVRGHYGLGPARCRPDEIINRTQRAIRTLETCPVDDIDRIIIDMGDMKLIETNLKVAEEKCKYLLLKQTILCKACRREFVCGFMFCPFCMQCPFTKSAAAEFLHHMEDVFESTLRTLLKGPVISWGGWHGRRRKHRPKVDVNMFEGLEESIVKIGNKCNIPCVRHDETGAIITTFPKVDAYKDIRKKRASWIRRALLHNKDEEAKMAASENPPRSFREFTFLEMFEATQKPGFKMGEDVNNERAFVKSALHAFAMELCVLQLAKWKETGSKQQAPAQDNFFKSIRLATKGQYLRSGLTPIENEFIKMYSKTDAGSEPWELALAERTEAMQRRQGNRLVVEEAFRSIPRPQDDRDDTGEAQAKRRRDQTWGASSWDQGYNESEERSGSWTQRGGGSSSSWNSWGESNQGNQNWQGNRGWQNWSTHHWDPSSRRYRDRRQ
jgi:hypothetical protein